MKKVTFLFLMVLTAGLFAQTDSTAVGKPGVAESIGLIVPILLAIYELIVRFVPTTSNLSILTLIMKIIKGLVPNKDTSGGTYD